MTKEEKEYKTYAKPIFSTYDDNDGFFWRW